MHMLRIDSRSIDGLAEAIDLDQTPAEIVILSFTDTDLSLVAAAWEERHETLPSLRLANLAALRHPFSVDLYLDKVLSRARFVLVRLLGGKVEFFPFLQLLEARLCFGGKLFERGVLSREWRMNWHKKLFKDRKAGAHSRKYYGETV